MGELRAAPIAVLALGFFVTAPVAAHETWMLPAKRSAADAVALELTSGMEFPANDHAPKAGRVTEGRCRRGDATAKLSASASDAHALALSAPLAGTGAVTCGLVLPAQPITLEGEHVEEYLAELDGGDAIRARWQRQGQWREVYRKSIKSITAGAAGDDVTQPLGLPLEIVPLHAWTPGRPLRVRVLSNGAPLPDFRLTQIAPGAPRAEARTDADGIAQIAASSADPLMLHGIRLQAAAAPDHEWDSDFTTLTLATQQD